MRELEQVEQDLHERNARIEAQTSAALAQAQELILNARRTSVGSNQSTEKYVKDFMSCLSEDNAAAELDNLGNTKHGRRSSTQIENSSKSAHGPSGQMRPASGKTATTSSKIQRCQVSNSQDHQLSSEPSREDVVSTLGSIIDVPGHPEASVRLHKVRLKQLQTQLEKTQKELKHKDNMIQELEKEMKALRSKEGHLTKAQKILEGQAEKYKAAAQQAEEALRVKDKEVHAMTQEGSQAERDRKAAQNEAKRQNAQLQRALEEVERCKKLLAAAKANERNRDAVSTEDFNRMATENKKLSKQVSELVVAFKKQMKLVEVLKMQKVHLEAARALAFTEREFLELLDQKA